MTAVNVPDLIITANTKVKTVRPIILAAGFKVGVVRKVEGDPREIDEMNVGEQSPTPSAKLTQGEIMHLYVTGLGGTGAKPVTPDAPQKAKQIIIVQAILIIVLVIYCFVLGR